MEKIIKENLIKNVILVILLVFLYFSIQNYLVNSNLKTDKALAGNILVAVSIIAVTACFGNFAFTYEKINPKNVFERYLAHTTTGLLMLIIGISLIFADILFTFTMGHFVLVDVTFILLYIANIGYDFWDLLKNKIK